MKWLLRMRIEFSIERPLCKNNILLENENHHQNKWLIFYSYFVRWRCQGRCQVVPPESLLLLITYEISVKDLDQCFCLKDIVKDVVI